MKVKVYTIVEFSIGNVIAGHSEIIDDVLAIEDRGDCYEVTIHLNRIRSYSKKYWKIEIL